MSNLAKKLSDFAKFGLFVLDAVPEKNIMIVMKPLNCAPLFSKKKKRVLLLVESSRAFGRGLIYGISQYVRQHDHWIIHVDEDRNTFESTVRRIENWNGDGIISRTFSGKMHRALECCGCPVVELSGDGKRFFAEVGNDNERIADLAVRYAWELGYTRFAFYSFGDAWWARERFEFFRRKLEESGFFCEYLHQLYKKRDNLHPLWNQRFEPELNAWLQSLPFPIFLWAASDAQAVRALEACIALEIRVPEEIAILGTDNDALLCNALTPPLSSIQTDAVRTGIEAARLLDLKMNGDGTNRQQIVFPPLGVVRRQSTDVMAIDDSDIALALRLIREEATYGLQVADIVKQINISQNTLCRRFRQWLGRTPEQEILRIRIERAKELLLLPDLTMEEIAERTGFGAVEYFMKVFLRKTGLTPARYRKRFQFYIGSNAEPAG